MKQSIYEQERAIYARASRAELRLIERALTMHAWNNDLRESVRLVAIRDLLAEKGKSHVR